MGIFDKLKQAANFVTGGGAKVTIQTADGVLDGTKPIPIIIHAVVKNAPINIERVYLRVRARETLDVPRTEIHTDEGDRLGAPVHDTHDHYRHEQEVSGPQELAANESYSWATEVTLPDEVYGSFQGRWCTHQIQVEGALDAKGNDPDSGWVTLSVMK